jgi:DNA repair exonuclease SbcCD ATPase subunit
MLNTLINEYLQKFDMFVSFELDETFNETIKSRNRDTFSYNSFSEGEKTRIDLSILFAWRKIAMSRNSISTNILIFDETLDRGLDEDSVNIFIDILNCLEEDVNSIVISHRNLVPEMFDRHLTVEKVRDFSVLSA